MTKRIWAVFSNNFNGEAIVFATTKEISAKNLASTLNMLKSPAMDEYVVHPLPLVEHEEEIDVLVEYEVFYSDGKVLTSNQTATWKVKEEEGPDEAIIVFDNPAGKEVARAVSLKSAQDAIQKAKKALKST